MVITFCGHSRFQKTEEYEQKLLTLLEKIVGEQPADMYLGGYGEFDAFAYDCCKKYKQTHPNVALIFITPYLTEEYQKNHLCYQKERYDAIVYPEIEDKPLRLAIVYRNRWMVEKADYVICGVNHAWGGAFHTYRYAKKKEKKTVNITENIL